MTMRVTMRVPRRSEDGLSMLLVGSIYTVGDDYGKELVQGQHAVDTDGVIASTSISQRDHLVAAEAVTTRALVSTHGIYAPNRCVILGDSITQYNTAEVSNATANQSRGYMTWANVLLGRRRLDVVANLGVGGDTTDMILARVATAAATQASWAVVLGGINDLAGNLTAPGIVTTNLQAIYAALLASGKRVVAISILPMTAAHPLFSRGLMARIQQVNRWIRSYCAVTPGMVFADGCTAVTDPASSDSAPVSGYYADTTHVGTLGAYFVGKTVADSVRSLISPLDEGPSSVGDSYLAAQRTITSLTGDGVTATATLAAHNLLAGDKITIEGATPAGYNGSWVLAAAPTTGTFTFSCTAASGSATGTIKVSNSDQLLDNPLFGTPSSGLASSWTKTENNTTTTTTTSARSDGLGNWQQLAIVASAAGDSLIYGGDLFVRAFPGDVLVLEVEVEVDAGWTALEGVQLNLNTIVAAVTYTPTAMNRLAGSTMPTAAWAGVLRTEPFTIPAGAVTRVRSQLRAFFSAAGGATVRFGRASLRKVR
jgi:lysophospholipase L1-like esterase